MRKRIFKFLGTLGLLPMLVVSGMAQGISISANVDGNPVALNQQFTYQVKVSGSAQNLPDVDMPDFKDFAVVGGPSVSSSVQIINFKMSASKNYTMYLMPKKPGSFIIGAASVSYKGKTYTSNPVKVTVVKGSPQTRQQQNRQKQGGRQAQPDVDLSKLLFIRAEPSKRSAYVNEEVTISYKIYFRTRITNNEVAKLPEAVGSWIEEYPIPQRPPIYNKTINGIRYSVAEIKKVAVFPSRSGKVTVSPLTLIVETVVRSKQRRDPFDMFDDFFQDPFGQAVRKQISSKPIEINVKPFPAAGRPADFSGLAGDFKMQTSVDKKETEANEAISYKIRISGSGLLKFLNELPAQFSPDFEVYDPKINESLDKTGSKISSTKDFEYVLIPRRPGDQEIKPFRLSYFDTGTKTYRYLSAPGYTIHVTPGKGNNLAVGEGTALSKEEVQLLGRDIRFIKESVPDFRPIGQMAYQKWWFYVAFIFPVTLLGLAWVYRNHLEKMQTNVEYARSRKANKIARRHLREAKVNLNQNNASVFYGAVSRALLGYVADKTNRPAAGLTRDTVQKILIAENIEGELQIQYMKILDEADFRRFAPGNSDQAGMTDFYNQAEQVLVGLEKYF